MTGSTSPDDAATAASVEGKPAHHPLHTSWQFYINEIPDKKLDEHGDVIHEGYRIQRLGKCDSVEEFWKEFKATEYPSALENTEAFYLMRAPFDPQWEKAEHMNGGRWRLKTDRLSADYLWCELAMCAVGEKLQRLVDSNNSIVGVGCSPRPSGIVIEIWTSAIDFDSSDTGGFAERFNKLLPQSLYFKLVYYENFAEQKKKKKPR